MSRQQGKAPIGQEAKRFGIATGIGAGTSAVSALALRKKKIPNWTKGVTGGLVSAVAGVGSMPIQSKLMQRSSHGQYTVTPAGVSRTRKKALPASSSAQRVDAYGNPTFAKADTYPGSTLTHGQKRARVMAAGTTPGVGDFAAAAAAGRMAPPNLRAKTQALQFSGSVGGSTVGATAGAYGGAALVKKVPAVRAHAEWANGKLDANVRDPINAAKARAAGKIHPKFGEWVKARDAKAGSTFGRRAGKWAASSHPGVARVGRAATKAHGPLAGAGAAAVLGAVVGQSIGSTAGSTSAYGHALHLEDKQRGYKITKSTDNRHGSRISKAESPKAMNRAEVRRSAKAKNQSAALSVLGSTTGLGALGSQVAGRSLGRRLPRTAARLKSLPVPLLTAGAGLGGVNGLLYARIQHKEAKRELAKGLLHLPRVPLVAPVKAPVPRAGGLVRTNGIVRTRRGSI